MFLNNYHYTAEKYKLEFYRIALFHMKARVCPIYFVHDCTRKRAIQKNSRATSALTGKKTADKMTNISRSSPKYSSETVTNDTENIGLDREIPKNIYRQIKKYTGNYL